MKLSEFQEVLKKRDRAGDRLSLHLVTAIAKQYPEYAKDKNGSSGLPYRSIVGLKVGKIRPDNIQPIILTWVMFNGRIEVQRYHFHIKDDCGRITKIDDPEYK